jgi:hypothetical protein
MHKYPPHLTTLPAVLPVVARTILDQLCSYTAIWRASITLIDTPLQRRLFRPIQSAITGEEALQRSGHPRTDTPIACERKAISPIILSRGVDCSHRNAETVVVAHFFEVHGVRVWVFQIEIKIGSVEEGRGTRVG